MNKKLIRLTESDLHRIVKESVKKILKEGDYHNQQIMMAREQRKVKDKAVEVLGRMGFKVRDYRQDNNFMLDVYINNYSDCEKIRNTLSMLFGVDGYYDMFVKHGYNLGSSEWAEIGLPASNKVKK